MPLVRAGRWPSGHAGRARRCCAACSGGGLNGVLAEPPGPAAHEVEQLGIRALEHHVERRMRSAVLL